MSRRPSQSSSRRPSETGSDHVEYYTIADMHNFRRTVAIDSVNSDDDSWSLSDESIIMERKASVSSDKSQGRKRSAVPVIGEAHGKEVLSVAIKVRIGTVDLQKRMSFPIQQKVWEAKLAVLSSFTPKEIQGGFNYGFFILPANNRAGKFLDDERTFKAYNLDAKSSLEFKYKKRVYRQMNIDFAQVRKNHTKANLRLLLDSIRNKDVAKLEKLLSEKFIDPNFIAESTGGETPLTLAASIDKSEEVIKVLVANGAHLDFRNKHGQTVVHKAVESGHPKNTELLLDLGASPNYRDPRGLTPAYYSTMHGTDPACLSILVKERAELDVSDDKGWRELHQACRHGLTYHLETLLSYYAEIDAQNEAGNTPLHVCASYNQVEAARILLFRGADKTIKNRANITACQVAVVSGNGDLAENIKNFSESDVVRIKEEPVYKHRRGLTASTAAPLKRTSSEPFIAKDPDAVSLQSKSSANSVPYDRRDSGSSTGYPSPKLQPQSSHPPPEYVAIQDYMAQGDNEISLAEGDVVEVLTATDDHFWEGRAQGDVGWFPSYLVRQVSAKKNQTDAGGMKTNKSGKGTDLNDAFFEPRVAVISRGKKGFGFVLRGAKSPKNPGIEFVPTREFPALQYLESVDKGSPADKEGLLKGDFVLEINGEDVRCAPHQQVVHMVLTAPDTLLLKVVTAPNPRGQETLSKMAAKNPKKLSRLRKNIAESDTWSVYSGPGDDRDAVIRPDVEIISIVYSDANDNIVSPPDPRQRPISSFFEEDDLVDLLQASQGLDQGGTPPVSTVTTPVVSRSPAVSHQDLRMDGHATLPNHARHRIQRPTQPPPPPNKFNTVARVHSIDSQGSQDMATEFETDIADGIGGLRRTSVGSDSAVSSSRSSPTSTHSYATSSSASGTDSAVNMIHDRTTSDPGTHKPPGKKILPPPPLRSSSLPPDNEPSSPTEEPTSAFAAAIAAAARKRSVAANEHQNQTEKSAFQLAMEAKERNMKSGMQGGGQPAAPVAPHGADDGSLQLLQAIKRRSDKLKNQEKSQDNVSIDSKINALKKQQSREQTLKEDDSLAKALAKRRSKMDSEMVSSSDDSSNSPVVSPSRVPPPPPPEVTINAQKPNHQPPPPPPGKSAPASPPKVMKKKPPPPILKEKPPKDPNAGILPPPASYSDGSMERGVSSGPGRFHSLERGSMSSSQSSISTVSTMSTDPSSVESAESTGERQEIFDSTNSLQSSSSTSSSVVTVKSTSDQENDNDGMTKDLNLINQQNGSSKPVAEWTSEDVSSWLNSINMSEYTNSFVENDICGEHLLTLTKDDLAELGVTRLGHKKTIMSALGKLSS